MRRFAAALAIAVAGCQAAPVQTPTRSFARPSDAALLCYTFDPTAGTALPLPLGDCTPNAAQGGADGGVASGALPRLFALVANSERGEVALVNTGPLFAGDTSIALPGIENLDVHTPGFGFLPVGMLPESIRATDDGCFAATANRGSCDLSLIDVPQVMRIPACANATASDCPAIEAQLPSTAVARAVPHVVVGAEVACADASACRPGESCLGGHCGLPIGAQPSWIELERSPPETAAGQGTGTGGAPGFPTNRCVDAPTAYTAVVAFPGCSLVARLELGSGRIEQAALLLPGGAGVTIVDPATLRCPNECTVGSRAAGPGDAGSALPDGGIAPTDAGPARGDAGPAPAPSDAGSAPAPTDGGLPPLLPTRAAWPQSLALLDDAPGGCTALPAGSLFNCKKVIVGDASSGTLVAIARDDNGNFLGGRAVRLAGDAIGVERLRLSPRIPDLAVTGDPSGPCANPLIASCAGPRFVYAIARDRTVRVLDGDRLVECQTNPDPAALDALANQIETAPGAPGSLVGDFSQPSTSSWRIERALRCLPVGDPTTPPQAPLAISPGIFVPGATLARDVVFTHPTFLDLNNNVFDVPQAVTAGTAVNASPTLLVGDYAWIVDSAGRAIAVNLADLCPEPNILGTPPSNLALPAQPVEALTATQSCLPSNYAASAAIAATFPGAPVPRAIEVLPNHVRAATDRFLQVQTFDQPGGPARLTDRPAVSINGALQNLSDPALPNLCDVASPDGVDPATTTGRGCLPEPATIGGNSSGSSSNSNTAVANFLQVRNPDALQDEGWTAAWEGLIPATTRTTGSLSGNTLNDPGAAFCSRGVLPGDKVYLTGCTDNTGCAPDQQCYQDPASQNPTVGQCLPLDTALFNLATMRDASGNACCSPWTTATLRYRVQSATQDAVVLAELPLPEHPADTHACASDADCADVVVAAQVSGVNQARATRCLATGPGAAQCLVPCTILGGVGECGAGYTCARSSVDGNPRCLRAPLPPAPGQLCQGESLLALCFGNGGPTDPSGNPLPLAGDGGQGAELLSYEVHAGEAFVVRGDVTGYLTAVRPDPATGQCVPPPLGDPIRLVEGRLPFDAPLCSAVAPGEDANWLAFLPPGVPNACTLAPPAAMSGDRFLRFDNPLLGFVVHVPAGAGELGSIDGGVPAVGDGGVPLGADGGEVDGGLAAVVEATSRVPAELTVIGWTVTGGFHPLAGALASDTAAQMPRSAVVAPDGQTVYVVDQGSQVLTSGLQGQLIRFFTATQSSDPNFLVR